MVDIKQDNTTEFKIIIVGDIGVGKTTFIKRHQIDNNGSDKKYIADQGVNVSSLVIQTNKGPFKLNIWDISMRNRLYGLRDGYYVGSDAAILMFDVTSRITYKNIPKWYREITKVWENIPIVMVGNKVDSVNRKLSAKQINFHRKKYIPYYDISAKSNYQYEKPFLWILRKLVCDPNLHLIENIPLVPVEPEFIMDQALIDTLEEEYMLSIQKHYHIEDDEEDV